MNCLGRPRHHWHRCPALIGNRRIRNTPERAVRWLDSAWALRDDPGGLFKRRVKSPSIPCRLSFRQAGSGRVSIGLSTEAAPVCHACFQGCGQEMERGSLAVRARLRNCFAWQTHRNGMPRLQPSWFQSLHSTLREIDSYRRAALRAGCFTPRGLRFLTVASVGLVPPPVTCNLHNLHPVSCGKSNQNRMLLTM